MFMLSQEVPPQDANLDFVESDIHHTRKLYSLIPLVSRNVQKVSLGCDKPQRNNKRLLHEILNIELVHKRNIYDSAEREARSLFIIQISCCIGRAI